MEFELLAEQIDRYTEAALRLDDEHSRDVAIKLKEAVEGIHREALVRMVRALKADPAAFAVLRELAHDPAVRMVLMLHEILRPPLGARIEQALDDVRPYIRSHGGDVELVEVAETAVRLRLTGACQGCPGSTATLRNGVEQAIRQHAPEVTTIELVEDAPAPSFTLISAAEIGVARPRAAQPADPADGWRVALRADQLDAGVQRVAVEGADLVVARAGGKVVCYRNVCAHMALPLHDGAVEDGVLTCPWHGFAYLLESGECLTAPEVQLEPVPVRVRAGLVEVRPVGVAV